ncbi:hypothetical protein HDU93_009142 [Gonapodya sp. JEL0774]|nr:hypothetical protein HDU93_009142 [Gonapodya sp. JEL0774]
MLDPSKIRPAFFGMLTSQAYTSPVLLDINRRNLANANLILDQISHSAYTHSTSGIPQITLKEAVTAICKEYSGGVRNPSDRQRFLLSWVARTGLGKSASDSALFGIPRTLPSSDLYCALIHPGHSHARDLFENWFGCFFTVLPLAAGLNLATTLAFRATKFAKNPIGTALPAIVGASRTSAFFGSLNVIYRAGLCATTDLIERGLMDRRPMWMYWALGIPAGLSVLCESPGRVRELNVFALPTAIEASYWFLKDAGYPVFAPVWELTVLPLSVGTVFALYSTEKSLLSPIITSLLKTLIAE